MKKIQALFLGVCLLLIGGISNQVVAQTCPVAPSSASPYVLIDSSYQVGTVASGKTYASFCYVNPTSTKITGLQFRIWYDKTAFAGANPVVTSANTSWSQSLNYVINTTEGSITITIVYTGSSSTFTIPDGRQFNVEFTHSANFQTYTAISNIAITGTTAFPASSANINGIDDALTLYNYGGVMKNVKLNFHGEFVNVTGSPAKNLTLALETKPKTGSTWTQVASYTTNTLGQFSLSEDVDTTYYDARLYVKGDTLGVGNIVSTADAQKINDWILGLATPAGFDYYTADVNGSNGITISDVYGVFGRIAGRFSAWPNTVKDVLFFSESEYATINGSSTNYRSTIPGTTNLYYMVSGIASDSVKFYVASPGDANGTGYHMARLTPIPIINPANAYKYVIDETVEYDNLTLSVMEVNVPKLSVEEGNLVNIPVKVITNGSDQVGALQLALKYDESLLEFRGVNGTEKSQKWMAFVNPSNGIVEWGGFDPTGKDNLMTSGEEIVTLQFAALTPQVEWGKSPLYTTRKFAGDASAKDMVITPTNGMVSVLKVSGGGFNIGDNDFEIYPNPTHGEIQVVFSVKEDTRATVSVYTIEGKNVIEILNEQIPGGNYRYSADLGFLTPGIYTAVLQTASDNRIVAKRIIKN
jgi:hypothetical protein